MPTTPPSAGKYKCQGPDGNAPKGKSPRVRCHECGLLLHRYGTCDDCDEAPHVARCGLICRSGSAYAEPRGSKHERADLHRNGACPRCDGLGYRPPECYELEALAASASLAISFGEPLVRLDRLAESAESIYEDGPGVAAPILRDLLEATRAACAAKERAERLGELLKATAKHIDKCSPGYDARRRDALRRIACRGTSEMDRRQLCDRYGIDEATAAHELAATPTTFTDERQ